MCFVVVRSRLHTVWVRLGNGMLFVTNYVSCLNLLYGPQHKARTNIHKYYYYYMYTHNLWSLIPGTKIANTFCNLIRVRNSKRNIYRFAHHKYSLSAPATQPPLTTAQHAFDSEVRASFCLKGAHQQACQTNI